MGALTGLILLGLLGNAHCQELFEHSIPANHLRRDAPCGSTIDVAVERQMQCGDINITFDAFLAYGARGAVFNVSSSDARFRGEHLVAKAWFKKQPACTRPECEQSPEATCQQLKRLADKNVTSTPKCYAICASGEHKVMVMQYIPKSYGSIRANSDDQSIAAVVPHHQVAQIGRKLLGFFWSMLAVDMVNSEKEQELFVNGDATTSEPVLTAVDMENLHVVDAGALAKGDLAQHCRLLNFAYGLLSPIPLEEREIAICIVSSIPFNSTVAIEQEACANVLTKDSDIKLAIQFAGLRPAYREVALEILERFHPAGLSEEGSSHDEDFCDSMLGEATVSTCYTDECYDDTDVEEEACPVQRAAALEHHVQGSLFIRRLQQFRCQHRCWKRTGGGRRRRRIVICDYTAWCGCSGLPANARWTGNGDPDANNCPWECVSGYERWGAGCRLSCGAGYKLNSAWTACLRITTRSSSTSTSVSSSSTSSSTSSTSTTSSSSSTSTTTSSSTRSTESTLTTTSSSTTTSTSTSSSPLSAECYANYMLCRPEQPGTYVIAEHAEDGLFNATAEDRVLNISLEKYPCRRTFTNTTVTDTCELIAVHGHWSLEDTSTPRFHCSCESLRDASVNESFFITTPAPQGTTQSFDWIVDFDMCSNSSCTTLIEGAPEGAEEFHFRVGSRNLLDRVEVVAWKACDAESFCKQLVVDRCIVVPFLGISISPAGHEVFLKTLSFRLLGAESLHLFLEVRRCSSDDACGVCQREAAGGEGRRLLWHGGVPPAPPRSRGLQELVAGEAVEQGGVFSLSGGESVLVAPDLSRSGTQQTQSEAAAGQGGVVAVDLLSSSSAAAERAPISAISEAVVGSMWPVSIQVVDVLFTDRRVAAELLQRQPEAMSSVASVLIVGFSGATSLQTGGGGGQLNSTAAATKLESRLVQLGLQLMLGSTTLRLHPQEGGMPAPSESAPGPPSATQPPAAAPPVAQQPGTSSTALPHTQSSELGTDAGNGERQAQLAAAVVGVLVVLICICVGCCCLACIAFRWLHQSLQAGNSRVSPAAEDAAWMCGLRELAAGHSPPGGLKLQA
mmetsp:Transcript_14169/g.33433  ORF Transcript_14169/g.33433 Transcript_14169/m.33433 type:complete len:1074 (+) Transcript_14169:84-3305(+)